MYRFYFGSGRWHTVTNTTKGHTIKAPHLFEHDSHSFHGRVLGGDLTVDVQRPVQDFSHFVRVDDGVVLGQVSVQLLDLVFQVLDLCLEIL